MSYGSWRSQLRSLVRRREAGATWAYDAAQHSNAQVPVVLMRAA